ncbi:VCBS repeat-containing protein [Streptomyces sp. SID8379]|uniref:FG-GAP repeat domain-containing protein n=1 Tax=unclassified Streptomyces TaxID=2593676 RepID=UPI0003817A20|nr:MULTISPECIES: VCBS repeat-containing protein [unclassified Streptomyces]MYW68779.1 VCBS repeat-containing protein [Streptomyces sp. SID8379]
MAGIRGCGRGGPSAAPRRGTAGLGGALLLAAALTGCGGAPHDTAAGDRPVALSGKTGKTAGAARPVPHGTGAASAKGSADFNGDGAPDLVLDDLAHDGLGDDPGIGIVYGKKGHGLTPDVRQLLTPEKFAAPTKGQTPAAFASEASCDLNADGFTDLVVSTDPPYDGQGQPPVPLQILFGSPGGIVGKGVKVAIPAKARFGNDWPDQPVCGDFDGDGKNDLVVHASAGQLSFLPGPFTDSGAPRGGPAGLARSIGDLPAGPAADVNGDGADDILVRAHGGTARSALVLGGPNGPQTPGAAYPAGKDVVFGRFGSAVLTGDGLAVKGRGTLDVRGDALDAGDLNGDGRTDLVVSGGAEVRLVDGGARLVAGSPGAGRVVAVADFDGDGRDDLVLQRASGSGSAKDAVTVFPGARGSALVASTSHLSFSTAEFTSG